jgi:hypothetical protein
VADQPQWSVAARVKDGDMRVKHSADSSAADVQQAVLELYAE